MRPQIPLKSIYAFITVAETGSMTQAADILNVSHSAVSQSIKSLETQLEQALFRRIGRQVELNNRGRTYYNRVAPAIKQIIEASEEIKKPENPNRLTLNMVTSMAIHWWIPRVQNFQQTAPDLDVRISNLTGPFDMEHEGIDVALIHGVPNEWENYYCDQLGNDELVMVCSPDILTPDATPSDLLSCYPAIYTANNRRKYDWMVWCKGNQTEVPKKQNSLSFFASIQGVQAAKQKLGVFVTHSLFVRDDIEQGLLTEVGKPVLNPHQSFFFACPEEKREQKSIQILRNWLHNEFNATVAK